MSIVSRLVGGDCKVMFPGMGKATVACIMGRRASAVVCLLVLLGCSVMPMRVEQATPSSPETADGLAAAGEQQAFTGTLKLLTLNMAHGRKDGVNQLFLSERTIRRNLSELAAFLRQVDADIIALQEADGPSRWSGNFNHVALIAQQAHYPWYARAGHARSWWFDYGTALLARGPFIEMRGHAFRPSPPTLTKGFLLGQIAWRSNEKSKKIIPVDIVSVHLDFSRAKIRQRQIAEMTQILADRNNALIVLGDFNSGWLADKSVVEAFACGSGLHIYRPEANDLDTYVSRDRRLDWILISDELEFESYAVLPNVVSDHYAVVAEVAIRPSEKAKRQAISTPSINTQPCSGGKT